MKIKNFLSKHKKMVAVGVAIIALIGGYSALTKENKNYTELSKNETTLIQKKDFVNTITESGKVKSEDSVDVYAEKSLPIKEINIKVGDKVTAGQVIAKLDDSSIRQQIETKQAIISSTNKSTNVQIKSASDKLNEAITNKNNGTNSQVVSANTAVLQAYDQLEAAQKTYDDYLRSINEGYNDAITAQKASDTNLQNTLDSQNLAYRQAVQKLNELNSELANAQNMYNEKSRELENLKAQDEATTRQINQLTLDIEDATIQLQAINTGSSTNANNQNQVNTQQETIRQYKQQLNELTIASAQLKSKMSEVEAERAKYKSQLDASESTGRALEKEIEQQSQNLQNTVNSIEAQKNQEQSAQKSRQDMLATYQNNIQSALNNYESAKKNLSVALAAQESEIKSLKSGVEQAKASGDNSVNSVDLKNLYEELEKTVIKAPITGTVTKMDMVKGQVSTVAVAQIQTLERKVIESQVKEYDYPKIKVGMEVDITSDALGRDKIFKGRVESINPTPKTAELNQAQANEVAYTTKISIDDSEQQLQAGMTTRIKYVLDSKKDVLTIPTMSIYKKGDKNFILVADDAQTTTIREVEVRIVGGNDVESIIESDEVILGLRVINSPDKYQSGTEVKLIEEAVEETK